MNATRKPLARVTGLLLERARIDGAIIEQFRTILRPFNLQPAPIAEAPIAPISDIGKIDGPMKRAVRHMANNNARKCPRCRGRNRGLDHSGKHTMAQKRKAA